MVYFIQCNGLTKIGVSKNPHARIKANTMNPYKLKLLLYFSGVSADCYIIENALHEHFFKMKIRGEWFAIPSTVLNSFLLRLAKGTIELKSFVGLKRYDVKLHSDVANTHKALAKTTAEKSGQTFENGYSTGVKNGYSQGYEEGYKVAISTFKSIVASIDTGGEHFTNKATAFKRKLNEKYKEENEAQTGEKESRSTGKAQHLREAPNG